MTTSSTSNAERVTTSSNETPYIPDYSSINNTYGTKFHNEISDNPDISFNPYNNKSPDSGNNDLDIKMHDSLSNKIVEIIQNINNINKKCNHMLIIQYIQFGFILIIVVLVSYGLYKYRNITEYQI